MGVGVYTAADTSHCFTAFLAHLERMKFVAMISSTTQQSYLGDFCLLACKEAFSDVKNVVKDAYMHALPPPIALHFPSLL